MANADNFKFADFFIEKEIIDILFQISRCYTLMHNDIISQNQDLLNDENEIRDQLHYNYLNKKDVKKELNLCEYMFLPEIYENQKVKNKRGRTDIRIMLRSSFEDPEHFYTIECKRLDGEPTLNKLYISNGIKRFVDTAQPLYSSYFGENAIIGFIVKKIDVNANIQHINKDISENYKNIGTLISIPQDYSIKYLYKSEQQSNNRELCLYHMMLDFSECINNN